MVDTESTEEQLPFPKPCAIRYKIECEDAYGPSFECEQDDKPFNLEVTEKSVIQQAGPAPVIEIITKLDVATKLPKFKWRPGMNWNTWGKDQKDADQQSAFHGSTINGGFGGYPGMFPGAYADGASDSDSEDGEKKEKKPALKATLENKRINKINETRIVIHSPWLLSVIREVVQYYPDQNLTGDTVTIHEPYHVLAHHITELRDVLNRLALEKAPSTDSDEDDEATTKYEHLKVLLDYIEPHVERTVLPARRRLKKDIATSTYADLWYLFRPGTLAYAEHDETWVGCVIESIAYRDQDTEDAKCTVTVWLLDHSWHSGDISQASIEVEIKYFEGEKVVTQLPVHPREYFDRTDGGKKRESFIKRGELSRKIAWEGHKYLFYEGRVMTNQKTHLKGAIIAETGEPHWVTLDDHAWSLNWTPPLDVGFIYDQGHLQKNNAPKLLKPLKFDPQEDKPATLTEDHLFLLCPVMVGFSLNSKSWMPLNVEFMKEIPSPTRTPDANIEAENLNIIKALSYRQTKSKLTWSADFIKNKGEGVVVLLHGPPGVGKTYTVETTAIHTRRPLIALTIGDLGSSETSIEDELSRWFEMATRWRAVLLIDEADIFLERRKTSELARNGVVTAFLRRIEYFGGLLFLTTNRIDTMDDAFMSRVHVVIGFDKLDGERRSAIWKSFFDKLTDEMGQQIRVSTEAQRYVLESDDIVGMDWNGREIRNAFQTAIALAEYEASEKEGYKEDGIVVEAEHFREVLKINRSFKSFVEKIKPKDSDSEWAEF